MPNFLEEHTPEERISMMREGFAEGYKRAIKDVISLLEDEDKDGDPDDLYAGREHRVKQVKSLNPGRLPSVDFAHVKSASEEPD